jgi:hypothetical protein
MGLRTAAAGRDLARIPADVKRLPLEHALESADDDKRSRAKSAFDLPRTD